MTKAAHIGSMPSNLTFHNKSPSRIHWVVLYTQCILLTGNSAHSHSSLTADLRLIKAALGQYTTPLGPLPPHTDEAIYDFPSQPSASQPPAEGLSLPFPPVF